jgi:predicted metal-dependent HD superfamily phosphohydrolase
MNLEQIERLEAQARAEWDASGRFYHNGTHLEDCLAQVETVHLAPDERRLLRWAIIWHDVVYDPKRSDNEAMSAERARAELSGAGVPQAEAAEVARLILLTAGHRVEEGDRLGALLVSIDLSILGAKPERYRAYGEAIRREYAHVPEDAYRLGRARVLRSLLAGGSIYPDPEYRARFEAQARENMERELEELRRG